MAKSEKSRAIRLLLNKQAKSLERMLCALTGIQNIHVTAVSDGVSNNPSRTVIKTKYQINIEIVEYANPDNQTTIFQER